VKTLHWIVDAAHLETPETDAALNRAAEILRAGGLVALPTETVYGLGANALDKAAVAKIFEAKQRPVWDPVIVHIASEAMLEGLAKEIPAAARRLMEAFWPGPLTLLLPRTGAVPDVVTAGRPLMGVRMPAHPVALELIRRAGVPVAAPSANLFSHISPTTAEHVLADLDGRIDAVVDAGPTARGVESTVLDPGTTPITIYRPGAVTVEDIRRVAGAAEIFKDGEKLRKTPKEALPSPGVGLRHYAPKARLILVELPQAKLEGPQADFAAQRTELAARIAEAARAWPGERLGVMLPADVQLDVRLDVRLPDGLTDARVWEWGRWDAPEEMARQLYAGLRALDDEGCSVILCPLPAAAGIGAALRDRLRKAASAG
jgi:L-threonylcarbamoyladenylate synthase